MLYPMMVIAAISVILFSIVGIGTMTGYIPSALSQKKDETVISTRDNDAAAKQAALQAQAELQTKTSAAEAEALAAKAAAAKAAELKAAETVKLAEADKAKAPIRRTAAPVHSERRAVPGKAAPACADCGVVESVRTQEVKGQGSGLGVVGGAVIGGVLGHQVGGGRGKDLATVAGAVGGGYAGNEVEKNIKKTVNYVIRVRMEDGTYEEINQATQPAVAAGDRVRIDNGVVVTRG